MSAETRTQRFPERTIRQVKLDCSHAMIRAKFCPDLSEVAHLRCMDDRPETEQSFGSQLWYFEGHGVDSQEQRHRVFGVAEYSLQFGLHELVEDRVFDSDCQREQYRHFYERGMQSTKWQHPVHRWMLAGLITIPMAWIGYLFLLSLMA